MRNEPIISLPPETVAKVRRLVIYDANDILAFNKPAGLAVQTRGNRGDNLDHWLWAFARSNGKRPRLVHRIDAGTSGLILAAHTKPAAASLSEQFANRTVRKRYIALVSGDLPEAVQGRCELPLRKQGRKSLICADESQGEQARTDWRILSRKGRAAWIEARPHTGRMHQIRAHMAALNMPLMGDLVYGAGLLTAPRLMLHAHRLAFLAPDGAPIRLEAPVPDAFKAVWESILQDAPDPAL